MVYKIFLDLVIIIFIMKILTEKEKFSARLKLALSAMAMQNLKTSEIATNLIYNTQMSLLLNKPYINGLMVWLFHQWIKLKHYLSGYQLNQNGYVMVWMIMKK